MKKTQIGAAAMALLLAAGLTACASELAPAPEDTTEPSQSVVDTTPEIEVPTEDPETPTEPAAPIITLSDQPDTVTVTEDDAFTYTLVQLGGVTADGQYLIRVLHDFEPGETIDFRSTDLSRWEPTGEEYLLTPAENVTVLAHNGEAWALEKLSGLRAEDYAYLTEQDGAVVAITLTEDAAVAGDATPEDAPSDPATEDAADAASDANAVEGDSD